MANSNDATSENNNVRQPPGNRLLPNQDPTSPFYLHPSDNSASQLVSLKFNGEGYGDWKRSMMISLSSKTKLGFMDGSIEEPVTTSPLYTAWSRCNDLIISMLLFNLDTIIARSVLYFQTAREIWIDLEERYGYVSGPQVFSLEQQIASFTQGSQSISEFFIELKALWDKLSMANPLPTCTCNNCTCNLTQKIYKLQQDHRLMQFLMKLGDQFTTARGNILMLNPLPTLSHAYKLLVQEERHKELSALSQSSNDAIALAADRRRFPDQTNSYRPFSQHNSYNTGPNKMAGIKRASMYFCDHCKIPGHSTERCFKLHGYPPGWTGFKDKGKKIAAVAHTEEQHFVHKSPDQSPMITVDQYQHLLSLIEKTQQQSTPSDQLDSPCHALMAGISYCFLSCSTVAGYWIVVPQIICVITCLCLTHISLSSTKIHILLFLMAGRY